MYILCNVGTMRPRILLEMKKDSLVSENIGSIVNSIVNSQPLSSKIDISKIFFGTQLAFYSIHSPLGRPLSTSDADLVYSLEDKLADSEANPIQLEHDHPRLQIGKK
jgi:hypothetical protein